MPQEIAPDQTPAQDDNLLQNVLAATDPVREILKFVLEQVDRRDPELGVAVRFLAIPRRFDAEIIGVLRQAPEDAEKNQTLLADVLRFSFVRTRPEGGYAYDDGTRRVLIEDWRAADRRETLDEYNQRLVDFYTERHEQAKQLQYDLDTVGRLIKEANPDRYVQVASEVEKRAVAPLLEALYHQTLISTSEAFLFFQLSFEDYEARGRLRVGEVLLHNAREYFEALPAGSGQEPLFAWLQYYHSRLKRQRLDSSGAESLLRDLLARAGEDVKLRLWALGDLSLILVNQYRLGEARQVHAELIRLAEETQADPYNLPVWQSSLARLHWTLMDMTLAVDKYRQAVQSAQETANLNMQVLTRMDLSGALQELGQLDEALDVALEGLDFARDTLAESPDVYNIILNDMANRFMHLFSQHMEARLLDTVYAEALAAQPEQEDPYSALDLHQQYLIALTSSSQLARAELELSTLKQEAVQKPNPTFAMELFLREASLRDSQGQFGESLRLYTRLAEVAKPNVEGTWYYATALNSGGNIARRLGRWAEAEANFAASLEKWQAVGHEKLVALVKLNQASAARQQGKLAEAQTLLDQARKILEGEISTSLADYHHTQGELYLDQAQWPDALQEYQQALEIYRRFNQPREVAQTLEKMGEAAQMNAQWEAAAKYLAEARQSIQQLAALDRYRPSQDIRRADRKNAEAMRAFADPKGDLQENMETAAALLKEAIKIEPDNFLYHLNLAQTWAALQRWGEAANELSSALDYAPAWLRRPLLYDRLVKYIIQRGEALAGKGQFEEAAVYYAETRQRFQDLVPFQQLAEVWVKLGDNLLHQNAWARAEAEFMGGLALAKQTQERAYQAAFHIRLGFLDAIRADVAAASEHFWQSLILHIQTSGDAAIQNLVDDVSELVVSGQQYHTFGMALRVLNQDPRLSPGQRRQLREARLQFSRDKYPDVARPLGTDADIQEDSFTPLNTPIVLEADDRLFPLGKDTPEVIRMLDENGGDIVEMRGRINTDTGVWIPGVRIRSSLSLADGRYMIKIFEAPVSYGQVMPGKKYCPDGAACRALGVDVLEPYSPADAGVWLEEADWPAVQAKGLPLLDAYAAMIFHLEQIIRHRLEQFLGVQEVQTLLDKWEAREPSAQASRRARREKALPDERALVRLVQVMKSLVTEGVPVDDLDVILPSFGRAQARFKELTDLVESVRQALKTRLPGNSLHREWIPLPPEFEENLGASIHERQGKHFLAAAAVEVEMLRNVVVELVGDRPVSSIALIASSPSLRPYVYRLVEDIYPDLMVLSEPEIKLKITELFQRKQYSRRIKQYTEVKGRRLGLDKSLRKLLEHRNG